jgi:iron complex outermembrane recepter protein
LKTNRLTTAVKNLLTMTVWAVSAGSAMAQEAPRSPSNVVLGDIVITGSRLARPELESPTPVSILTRDMIDNSGEVNIADVLRDMPGVGISGISSANSNFSTSGGGINTVNLRNLGDARTLVLVDGRRFVPGVPGTSIVDFNMIPTDFIERIDVITGGASAVYGSEAIAGVVNVIMKNHFEGVDARAQMGGATEGGANTRSASLTMGSNFADNRGNAMVNIAYSSDSGVWSGQRAISTTDTSITHQGITGAFSSFNPQGNIVLADGNGNEIDGLYTFDSNNNVVPYDTSLGFNRDAYRRITIPTDRTLLSSIIKYDVADHQQVYSELTYGYTHTHTAIEPFALGIGPNGTSDNVYAGYGGIPLTNAYIPTQLADIIAADNQDLADNGDPSCITQSPDVNCVTYLGVRKRLTGVAIRSSDAVRQTARVVTGMKGDLFGTNWNYDVYYMYGRTTDAQTSTGQVNVQNLRYALDSVNQDGTIVCRDLVAQALGCVPINVFGANSISPAAAAYINSPATQDAVLSQQVVSAVIDGSLMKLPAGDLHAVFGAERRTESSSQIFDSLTNSGLNGGNALPNVAGSYHVTDVFTEVAVPLLANRPWVKDLTLEGAARSSDYSTVGRVSTWNIRLNYAPNDDFRVRAAYSHAVRAPGIGELYATPGQTFPTGIQDPCDLNAAPTGALLAACQKIPAIAQNGLPNYNYLDYQLITGFNGGNIHLQSETAKTTTVGLVFTPQALRNFTTTLDFFNVQIDGAVGSADYYTEISQCLLTGAFCSQIVRDPTSGKLTRVDQNLINVATVKTAGVDLASRYRLPIDSIGAHIDMALIWTYLAKYDFLAEPGAPLESFVGQIGTPRHRATFNVDYAWQGLSAGWTTRYQSASKDQVNLDNVSPNQAPFNSVAAYIYHDLHARYTFDFLGKTSVFGGVRNVFDKKPPFLPTGMSSTVTGTETAPDAYDAIGRQFFLGFEIKR